jgi:cell wall-associated NlpC family hydrolase
MKVISQTCRWVLLCWFLCGSGLIADDRFVHEVHRLAETGLPYLYGSATMEQGGLDCSGFVMLAARRAYGIELPDEAGKQLNFARQYGKVWDANSAHWKASVLRPGDLIFWTGTMPCNRPSPVTHVMVYLGGERMAGAQSLGRRQTLKGAGVGFYDFNPTPPRGNPRIANDQVYRSKMMLYAYARIDFKGLAKRAQK